MGAEHGLCEVVVHHVLRGILVHGYLLQHDLALAVQIGERGVEQHVHHHLHGARQVLVKETRVHHHVLARGGRVEFASHGVEDLSDLLGRMGARTLEQQVLYEVSGTGQPAAFHRASRPVSRNPDRPTEDGPAAR